MSRTLGGAWELLDDVVGRGASSEVRLGRRIDDGAPVAVKLLRHDRVAEPAALQRFAREFAVLRASPHPNIVSVLDLVSDNDDQAIVMEHVSGGDLRSRLQASPGRRLDGVTALRLAAEIADGLAHIHAAGAVHRDVKPENILLANVDGTDVAKLSDFGLARLPGSATVTHDGAFRGTPDYAAPEVLTLGRKKIGAAADVYSLGCVLYEMLAGAPPFASGGDVVAVALRHAMEPPARPDGIGDELWALLAAMLAKTAKDRPDAAEVGPRLRAMDAASIGSAVAAPPAGAAGGITLTVDGEADASGDGAAQHGAAQPDGDEGRARPRDPKAADAVPLAMAAEAMLSRPPVVTPPRPVPRAGSTPRRPTWRRAVAIAAAVTAIAAGVTAAITAGDEREQAVLEPISLTLAPAQVADGVAVEFHGWAVDTGARTLTATLRLANRGPVAVEAADGALDVVPSLLRADARRLRSADTLRASAAGDGTVFVVIPVSLAPGETDTVRYELPIRAGAVDRRRVLDDRRRVVDALAAEAAPASTPTPGDGATDPAAADYVAAVQGAAPVAAVGASGRGAATAVARSAAAPPPGRSDQSPRTVTGGAPDAGSRGSHPTSPPPTTSPPTTAAPTTTTQPAPSTPITLYTVTFGDYGRTADRFYQSFTARRSTVTAIQLYLRWTNADRPIVGLEIQNGTGQCDDLVRTPPAGGEVTAEFDCEIPAGTNTVLVNLKGRPVEVGLNGGRLSGRITGHL